MAEKIVVMIPDDKLGEPLNLDSTQYVEWKAGETKIEKLANMGDGYLFDWDNLNGMTLYAILNKPSLEETEAIIHTNTDFEIAFSVLDDVAYLCVRFGKLPWGEGTIEPCLYDSFDMPYYDDYDAMGMALNIVLVDPSEGGLIKGIRLIGLGHDFSMKLAEWCNKAFFNKARRSTFSMEKHYKAIDKMRTTYSSKELANKAIIKWKLGSDGDGKERTPVDRGDR